MPQLADRWGVHRLTGWKALAGLKRTGWIQTVLGRDNFVVTHARSQRTLGDGITRPED